MSVTQSGLTVSGTYTGTSSKNYVVEIAANSAKYNWSDDGGTTWEAVMVPLHTTTEPLNKGVTIAFASTTGHTTGDSWEWTSHYVIPINTENMAMINDDGRRDVIFYDETNSGINSIVDLHGSSPSLGTISATTKSSVAMQVNNKEVHIGMGRGDLEFPKWAGIISHKQFGNDYSDAITVESGILSSPSLFPDLYSTVEIGDYIYGIEWQGKFIYKFVKSTQSFERKSEQTFLKTQGLAVRNIDADGNKGLWVFDGDPSIVDSNGEGRLYALTTDDMSLAFHCDIVDVTTSHMDNFTSTISDIIQTGDIATEDVIWFSRHFGTDGGAGETFPKPAGSDGSGTKLDEINEWLWNVETPTAATTLDPLNRSFAPILNSDTGWQALGSNIHSRNNQPLRDGANAHINSWDLISETNGLEITAMVIDTDNRLIITVNEDLNQLEIWSYDDTGAAPVLKDTMAGLGNRDKMGENSVDFTNRIIFIIGGDGDYIKSYTYDSDGDNITLADTLSPLTSLIAIVGEELAICCDTTNKILFAAWRSQGGSQSEMISLTYETNGDMSLPLSRLVDYQDEDPGASTVWNTLYANNGILCATAENMWGGLYTFEYNTSTGEATGWDSYTPDGDQDDDLRMDYNNTSNLWHMLSPNPSDPSFTLFAAYRGIANPYGNYTSKVYSFIIHGVTGAISAHATSPQQTDAGDEGASGYMAIDTHSNQLITCSTHSSHSEYRIQFYDYEDDGTIAFATDLDMEDDEANTGYGTGSGDEISQPYLPVCDPDCNIVYIASIMGFWHARYYEKPICNVPKKCLVQTDNTQYVGVLTNPGNFVTNSIDREIQIYDDAAWQDIASLVAIVKYDRTAWTAVYNSNSFNEGAYELSIPADQNILGICSFGYDEDFNENGTIAIISGAVGGSKSIIHHNSISATMSKDLTLNTCVSSSELDISEGTPSFEEDFGNGIKKFNIMAGNGVGQWLSVNFRTSPPFSPPSQFYGATPIMQSLLEIELDHSSVGDGFGTSERVWYKASFVYDGYQESPLGDLAEDTNGNTYIDGNNKDIQITLTFRTADTVSKRVSHLRLYRAVEPKLGAGIKPSVYFRFFKQFALNTNFILDDSDTSNPEWETVRERIVYDDYSINGGSYESIVGISESLDNTWVNYGLSAQLNNQLFVSKCYHPQIDGADNFMFKSKPYNFDQFDPSVDLLKLPTVPTALASYNGRIYAFDENNTYRIEPNYLYVEDTFEGVGCLNQDSVSVTEYGMCFLDKNNIYLHNGVQPVPIGDPIVRGDTKAWQNVSSNWTPKVLFDASRNSYVALFYDGSGDYYGWAFNLTRRRWDLWHFDSTEPKGLLTGKSGEIFVNNGTNLISWLGGSGNDAWSWTSKKITMDTSTQVKFFKKTRVAGISSSCIDTIITSEGAPTKSGSTDGNQDYVYSLGGSNAKAKWIQYTIANESGSNTVDAIGTIFRRRGFR